MALSDDVQDRYGTEFLVNLTNPFAPDQTSIDTARLGLASTDVESDLILYCGMTYSSMQALANLAGPCTSVAVEGVVAKLQIRTGAAGATATEGHDKYIERLKSLARIAGRDRVSPRTDSVMTPSSWQVGDETVRPAFDWPKFGDWIPGGPDADKDRSNT
jgi:hypothetical protein|tara:strand:+ start:497 stop:976 length:480 start_codon:yes stop_codon:yes gene_type:complete